MNSLPRPGSAWATSTTASFLRTDSGSHPKTRSNPSQTVAPKITSTTAGDSATSLCRSAHASTRGKASRTSQNASSSTPTTTPMNSALPTVPGSGPSGSHAEESTTSTMKTATRFADHSAARATFPGSHGRTR